MPDVVFVCVREDVPLAEALADACAEAGFSIGEWAGDGPDICGAAILLWSTKASRSPAFLKAAERFLDADNAVIVTSGPLAVNTPSDVGQYDLSAWNGDPEDTLLEPLFAKLNLMARVQHDVVVELAPLREPIDGDVAPDDLFGELPLPPRDEAAFKRWSAAWSAELPTDMPREMLKGRSMPAHAAWGGMSALLLAFMLGGAVFVQTLMREPAPVETAAPTEQNTRLANIVIDAEALPTYEAIPPADAPIYTPLEPDA